jgi:diguanylate cyclase (GGDEF)-like protein
MTTTNLPTLMSGLPLEDLDPHARIAAVVRDTLPDEAASVLLGRIADALEELVPRDWESLAIENAELKQEVEQLASSDPLTGLRNRRQFFEDLAREFAGARRYNDSLSLLLIDLDDLKHINETDGFEAGDELLRRVAETLLTRLRVTDIAARIGGDSFAVILTRTTAEGARAIADRLPGEMGARVAIGVATLDHDTISGAGLLERADQSLLSDRGILQRGVRARSDA